MIKILHVKTPYYDAEARFEKDRTGRWRCVKATPSTDWMEVVTLETVKIWLERNRYEYHWKTDQA